MAPERDAVLRALGVGAWLLVSSSIVIAVGMWLASGAPRQPAGFIQGTLGVGGVALSGLVYASVAAFLIRRSPRNAIGWVFLAIGVGMAIVLPVNQMVAGSVHPFRPVPTETLLVAWAFGSVHLPASGVAVVAVLLLTPSGRPEWRPWRVTLAVAVAGGVALAASTALRHEGLLWFPTLPNPLAAPTALAPLISGLSVVGVVTLVVGFVMAAVGLLWRYRTGDTRHRRQLAWVALGSAAMVASVALLFIVRYAGVADDEQGERLAFVAAVGSVILPLSLFRFTMVTASHGQETADLTFLFTDLQDSTAMYERVGDATAFNLVRLHFNTLESATRAHGGTIVKTIGDAIMATFSDPGEAVRTALEMFERLELVNRSTGSELVLKVGLHRGQAIAVTSRGRRDYFGQTVNVAARLGSLAGAGEIVLSEELHDAGGVAELLDGLPIHHERGVLKGVAGEVPLYRVMVAPETSP
jgi:class 3 adenylate cyclase